MILEDIKSYLEAYSITPIYLSFEPPSSGITLYLYPGRQADPWNPEYKHYNLQVVTRYDSFPTAQSVAVRVSALLTNLAGVIGNTDIINFYPNQDPYQQGYDEQNFAKMAQNFAIEAKDAVDGRVVILSVDWANVYNTPTTISGYGITDVLSSNRNITINGVTQDLSADRTWNVGDLLSTQTYNDPAWLVSLDYSKILNAPSISGGLGTVTSVGLSLPSLFSVTGSPITGSGTLTATLATQLQNRVFASPDGSTGIPTFRSLVAADIPNLPWSILTGTPTTLAGYGITDPIVLETGSYANPTWITSLAYSKLTGSPVIPPSGVTYVGLAVPSILSLTGSPVTSSGMFTIGLNSQTQNTFFAAPNGSDGTPTFRSIVLADLPSIPFSSIASTPTTLAGYGITDAVNTARNLTINGQTQNLSADRTWGVGDVYTTSGYVNPDWITSLPWSKITDTPTTLGGYGITDGVSTGGSYANPAWITSLDFSKITNVPPSSGTGTVYYVGLTAPNIFNVAGSPIVSSGTFALTLATQAANTFLAGATSGGASTPAFRALDALDIPVHNQAWSTITSTPTSIAGYGILDALVYETRLLTINGNQQSLAADRTWSVGDVFTTSGYVNPSWITSLPWSKITATPTTLAGYGITDPILLNTRTLTINGLEQDLTANRTWNVGDVFTTSGYVNPSWITSLAWGKITGTPTTLAGYGITDAYTKTESNARYADISISGSIRTVGLALPSFITVNNSPLVGPGGTISGVLTSQTQNTVFSAPNGSNGTPTFRTLVLADLPTISFANIASTPTTIAGYGITDAYTKTQSDTRYVPSGLYPSVPMYWTTSGNICYVAHSGNIQLGYPYVAGSGFLSFSKASAANQALFTPVTTFPVILSYNDVFMVSASGVVIYKSANFPRIA